MICLTKKLTSNNDQGYIITANSEIAGYYAYKCILGENDTPYDYWINSDYGNPNPWMQIQFPEKCSITRIALSFENSNRKPNTCTLLGSSDNVNFTTITTINISNINLTFYDFNNNQYYQIYKFQYNGNLPIGISCTGLKCFGEWIKPIKFLIKDGTNYKTYTGSSWEIVTSDTPTSEDFLNYGFEDINNLINNFSNFNTIQILMYSTDNLSSEKNIIFDAIPKSLIIKQQDDILLSDVLNINHITFNHNQTNLNSIKCFVSNDLGESYYSFKNSNWNVYDVNKVNILNYGMTLNEINQLTNLEWKSFFNNTYSKLRFIFLIDLLNISNICNIDYLNLTVDIKGVWEICANTHSVYKFKYINNNLIKAELYSPGNYKINY